MISGKRILAIWCFLFLAFAGAADASGFASKASYDVLAKQNASVSPAVPAYKLRPKLANVANLKDFKSILEPKLTAMIVKNGFAVAPTNYIQMFHVYENNEYQRPHKFGSFITTDSMLHTYHVFYDYTLRQVESKKLFDAAVKLTDAMLAASGQDLIEAKDPAVRDAAKRNVAYFALGRVLLGGAPAPEAVKDMVEADRKLINAHGGIKKSAILGLKMDFSQFVPRGHYTRTEKLKKYFKAMMWYGLSPLPVPQGKFLPRATVQALLMTRNLRAASIGGKSALSLWDTIYEPTAFYVGVADDYTFYQYSKLADKVYGKNPRIDEFADNTRLIAFFKEVDKLPEPGIDNTISDPEFPGGRQFRFMGQRFIPDSRIFRQMTDPHVAFRGMPRGLDAFAAMGSNRALQIMKASPSSKHEGYDEQMAKMRKEMKDTPREKWQSNLYYGWLWSLQAAVQPASRGYPMFMNSTAWVDKSLVTALGSWTELRHDTILYAKQSMSECGGDSDEPPTPRGYVEPNLEFWTRLKWLNEYTLSGLASRGLLTDELKDKFVKMDDWLTFCRRITIKELTNKKVTDQEYQQICLYGAEMENLTLSFAEGDLVSDTDKDMSVVADAHTSSPLCLEEATGRAAAIYVVVPIRGKLYLTRGAVYTHYEFEWPMSDRLSDEKWQEMLKAGKTPKLADWIKSFYVNTKKKPKHEFAAFSGGC